MLFNKKIIAIIPARGGSKGIPNKNIYPICGKPLIIYTLEQALKCPVIDLIYVSTDSTKIAEIVENFGIRVPELRPAELSGDTVKTIDVVKYVLQRLYPESFDILLLLQPTSPLRTCKDIKNCLEIVCSNNECTSVASVCAIEDRHPYKIKKIVNGKLLPFIEGASSEVPRQQLPPSYRLNGAVYATKISVILNEENFFGSYCIPYIMPEERSVSIDNLLDILLAEHFIRKNNCY